MMELEIKDLIYLMVLIVGVTGCYWRLKAKIIVLETKCQTIMEKQATQEGKLDMILKKIEDIRVNMAKYNGRRPQ